MNSTHIYKVFFIKKIAFLMFYIKNCKGKYALKKAGKLQPALLPQPLGKIQFHKPVSTSGYLRIIIVLI